MKMNNTYSTNHYDTVSALRAFFDENGEYFEERHSNISIDALPFEAIERVALGYDITVLYSRSDVFVIAENLSDIDEYLSLSGKTRCLTNLIHTASNTGYDAYMCIAANLSPLRRSRTKSKMQRAKTKIN